MKKNLQMMLLFRMLTHTGTDSVFITIVFPLFYNSKLNIIIRHNLLACRITEKDLVFKIPSNKIKYI